LEHLFICLETTNSNLVRVVAGKTNRNSQAIAEQDQSVIDNNTWTDVPATNPAQAPVPTEASSLSSSTATQAPTTWASLLK
jgi:hypothetical protein